MTADRAPAPAPQGGGNKPAFQDDRDQPFTIPHKPRGGCKNIRKHHSYKKYLKQNKNILVQCASSCSNGKTPCRRPDQSFCRWGKIEQSVPIAYSYFKNENTYILRSEIFFRFTCKDGSTAQPELVASCIKQKGGRSWTMSLLPQTPPRCA